MPVFAYGNFEFGLLLSEVLVESITLRARLTDFDQLAPGNTVVAAQLMADCVNRSIKRFMQALPRVGLASEPISITSATNLYPIPTLMYGRKIVEIRYSINSTNGNLSGQPIKWLGLGGRENFPISWVNGQATSGVQQFATLDELSANLQFWPPTNTTYEIEVFYQQAYTPITGANVTSPGTGPVSIGEIPTEWKRQFCELVAAELLDTLDDPSAQAAQQKAEAGILQMQKMLTAVQAADSPIQSFFGAMGGPQNFNANYRNMVY